MLLIFLVNITSKRYFSFLFRLLVWPTVLILLIHICIWWPVHNCLSILYILCYIFISYWNLVKSTIYVVNILSKTIILYLSLLNRLNLRVWIRITTRILLWIRLRHVINSVNWKSLYTYISYSKIYLLHILKLIYR